MAPMCGTEDVYEAAIRLNRKRQDENNGELEDAEGIRNAMIHNIEKLFLDSKNDIIFISNSVLRTWCREADPHFGGKSGRAIPHILETWGKTKMIPELSSTVTRFPPNNPVHRGLVWNYPKTGLKLGETSNIKMIVEDSKNEK